jgi:hypothetical protein
MFKQAGTGGSNRTRRRAGRVHVAGIPSAGEPIGHEHRNVAGCLLLSGGLAEKW